MIVEGRRRNQNAADESREMVPSKTPEQAKSTFVYVVGGLLYAVLCGPAIGRRGFPPIDPALMALTFLWIVPIFLATILDDRPFRRRLNPRSQTVSRLASAYSVIVFPLTNSMTK